MQLFELIFVRTHNHFYNTLVPINNKTTIISKPGKKYFYDADTECQMAMLHHHKRNSKHNRAVD